MADTPSPSAPGNEELVQLIFDSATDYAIFSVDPEGLVTSWNRGAERVLGWTTEEILGRSADVIFPPEDRAAGAAERERAQAAATGRADDERWQQRRDGSLFWASGLMLRLADPSLGFAKILRDRTERHHAEERLRQSEERFRILATHVPQLVFQSRADGDRTWPSPQWSEFTGVSAADSAGFGWLEAIHPDDREGTLAAWREAARTGEHYSEQRVRRHSDGQWRWHQTRARPVPHVAGLPGDWIGTMTDVHDLVGLQERQKMLVAELQHRTRNLLALTHSIALQTMRRTASFETFQREFDVRLRALSRVQALVTGVDYGNVDLRDLLTAELQAHDGGRGSDRITIEGPALPLPSSAAQALGLALHELVTNAAKYGALLQERGRLAVTWQIGGEAGQQRYARLTWKETGVTIPERTRVEGKQGYGRQLIENALPYQLAARTSFVFEPDGVRCTIEIDLDGA